jgi:hypothetical protein
MTPEELAQELAGAALVYELNPDLRGDADDVYDFLADALLEALEGHAVIDGQPRKLPSIDFLTDDGRYRIDAWIRGAERGEWKPTKATQQVVASILRAVLLLSESRVSR